MIEQLALIKGVAPKKTENTLCFVVPFVVPQRARCARLETAGLGGLSVLCARLTVRNHSWKSGRGRGANPKLWTPSQVELLRMAYRNPTAPLQLKGLAYVIGRSIASIACKANSLGLTSAARGKLGHGHRHIKDERCPLPGCAFPLRPKRNKCGRTFGSIEELRAYQSATSRDRIKERGHPRGMLGRHHTEDTRSTISEKSRATWRDPTALNRSEASKQRRSDQMHRLMLEGKMRQGYTRCAGGKRADLDNMYFRSSWEANYARYLNWLRDRSEIVAWSFESKTFVFAEITRGTRSYTPDFFVRFADGRAEWHEVKGWMDPKSKTRLARMSRFFPDEVVVVIGADWFAAAHRSGLSALIPNWERGRNFKRTS